MKYFKITLLLLAAMALTAQGCSLKQPEPADVISDLDEEREDLNEREQQLDRREKELERQEDAMEEDQEIEDEKIDDEEMTEDDEEDMEEDQKLEEKKNLNERGREMLGKFDGPMGENELLFFLTASQDEYTGTHAMFKVGCDDVLVLSVKEYQEGQSKLATAIVTLLTTKRTEYLDELGATNDVSGSGLVLANVSFEDGKRIVEFEGQPTSGGVCESARIKAQIEETIALYADEFEIRLNGSAAGWRCLYNESGECE